MPDLTQEQLAARSQSIDKLDAGIAAAQNIMKRMAAIGPTDAAALVGLLNLYEFHDGDVDEGFAHNYLGKFVFNLLRQIAWDGAAEVANDPDQIVKTLQEEIALWREDLSSVRLVQSRYAMAIAQVQPEADSEGAAAGRKVAQDA